MVHTKLYQVAINRVKKKARNEWNSFYLSNIAHYLESGLQISAFSDDKVNKTTSLVLFFHLNATAIEQA